MELFDRVLQRRYSKGSLVHWAEALSSAWKESQVYVYPSGSILASVRRALSKAGTTQGVREDHQQEDVPYAGFHILIPVGALFDKKVSKGVCMVWGLGSIDFVELTTPNTTRRNIQNIGTLFTILAPDKVYSHLAMQLWM